ncbi:hypothetical protein J6590_066467 [Homalodisca vitripennis]|nr:hypothetical protein J6590_066467 [Homalodisca vitripennis]
MLKYQLINLKKGAAQDLFRDIKIRPKKNRFYKSYENSSHVHDSLKRGDIYEGIKKAYLKKTNFKDINTNICKSTNDVIKKTSVCLSNEPITPLVQPGKTLNTSNSLKRGDKCEGILKPDLKKSKLDDINTNICKSNNDSIMKTLLCLSNKPITPLVQPGKTLHTSNSLKRGDKCEGILKPDLKKSKLDDINTNICKSTNDVIMKTSLCLSNKPITPLVQPGKTLHTSNSLKRGDKCEGIPKPDLKKSKLDDINTNICKSNNDVIKKTSLCLSNKPITPLVQPGKTLNTSNSLKRGDKCEGILKPDLKKSKLDDINTNICKSNNDSIMKTSVYLSNELITPLVQPGKTLNTSNSLKRGDKCEGILKPDLKKSKLDDINTNICKSNNDSIKKTSVCLSNKPITPLVQPGKIHNTSNSLKRGDKCEGVQKPDLKKSKLDDINTNICKSNNDSIMKTSVYLSNEPITPLVQPGKIHNTSNSLKRGDKCEGVQKPDLKKSKLDDINTNICKSNNDSIKKTSLCLSNKPITPLVQPGKIHNTSNSLKRGDKCEGVQKPDLKKSKLDDINTNICKSNNDSIKKTSVYLSNEPITPLVQPGKIHNTSNSLKRGDKCEGVQKPDLKKSKLDDINTNICKSNNDSIKKTSVCLSNKPITPLVQPGKIHNTSNSLKRGDKCEGVQKPDLKKSKLDDINTNICKSNNDSIMKTSVCLSNEPITPLVQPGKIHNTSNSLKRGDKCEGVQKPDLKKSKLDDINTNICKSNNDSIKKTSVYLSNEPITPLVQPGKIHNTSNSLKRGDKCEGVQKPDLKKSKLDDINTNICKSNNDSIKKTSLCLSNKPITPLVQPGKIHNTSNSLKRGDKCEGVQKPDLKKSKLDDINTNICKSNNDSIMKTSVYLSNEPITPLVQPGKIHNTSNSLKRGDKCEGVQKPDLKKSKLDDINTNICKSNNDSIMKTSVYLSNELITPLVQPGKTLNTSNSLKRGDKCEGILKPDLKKSKLDDINTNICKSNNDSIMKTSVYLSNELITPLVQPGKTLNTSNSLKEETNVKGFKPDLKKSKLDDINTNICKSNNDSIMKT